MKKVICLFIFAAIMIVNVSSVGLSVSEELSAASAKIDSKIIDIVSNSEDVDKKIQVAIELVDNIDSATIELEAMNEVGISIEEMENDIQTTYALNNADNIEMQEEVLTKSNLLRTARNEMVKEHYLYENTQIYKKYRMLSNDKVYISKYAPIIYGNMTFNQITEISRNEKVAYINYVGDIEYKNFSTPSLHSTFTNVGGDYAINEGYTGSGIRVGVIERGHPDLVALGTNGANIIRTNFNDYTASTLSEVPHATEVCGIIKKFAPDCTIYTRHTVSNEWNDLVDFFCQLEYLIDEYTLDVINISYGQVYKSNGVHETDTRHLNYIIYNTKTPIIVAAGNKIELTTENGINTYSCVNTLGLAPNAITVGATYINGNGYTLSENSCYSEGNGVVNKPDICAPGVVAEHSIYHEDESCTSFATAIVTGTVVQMLSRNVWLTNRPQTIKSILMASAKKNCGTNMEYLVDSDGVVRCKNISNEEGAGVVDSAFCYRVAKNGRYVYTELSSSSPSTISYNAYADYTTVPLRVAVAWDTSAITTAYSFYNNDYNVRIYKNNVLIAKSTAPSNNPGEYYPSVNGRTNYEIIEIPVSVLQQYGAGYYEVRVYRAGSFLGNGTVGLGIAWEQNW